MGRSILRKHEEWLKNLDAWFQSIRSAQASRMQCANGCARCCHGLFDVSLPDALLIMQGFRRLSSHRRQTVFDAASAIQKQILRECPELEAPYFLCGLSEDTIDRIAERVGEVRCPLLDEADCCLIYGYRPLACRLEGVPMVDARDGLFGDWCELNFRGGAAPELLESLRLDYYRIQDAECAATAHLSQHLFGVRREEMTIFIPSAIVASDALLSLSLGVLEPLN
jgi:Fe-S-cluster containining protein